MRTFADLADPSDLREEFASAGVTFDTHAIDMVLAEAMDYLGPPPQDEMDQALLGYALALEAIVVTAIWKNQQLSYPSPWIFDSSELKVVAMYQGLWQTERFNAAWGREMGL